MMDESPISIIKEKSTPMTHTLTYVVRCCAEITGMEVRSSLPSTWELWVGGRKIYGLATSIASPVATMSFDSPIFIPFVRKGLSVVLKGKWRRNDHYLWGQVWFRKPMDLKVVLP